MRGPRVDVVRAEAEPAAGPELINESERTSGKTRLLGEPGAAFDVEGLLNIFFFAWLGAVLRLPRGVVLVLGLC